MEEGLADIHSGYGVFGNRIVHAAMAKKGFLNRNHLVVCFADLHHFVVVVLVVWRRLRNAPDD